MRDTTTQELVDRLILRAKETQRAQDILLLDKRSANASALKKAQRNERNALKALNAHLKECIKVVQQGRRKK